MGAHGLEIAKWTKRIYDQHRIAPAKALFRGELLFLALHGAAAKNRRIERSQFHIGGVHTMKTHRGVLVRTLFLIALAAVFFVQGHAAQDVTVNIKVEDFRQAFLNQEPIKIVGLYIGRQEIKSGADVLANVDWLHDFRVVVKNVSDQGIKEISVNLELPTGDEQIGDRLIGFHWGRDYYFNLEGTKAGGYTQPDLLLLPGESTSIALTASYYDALKDHLAHGHESSYTIPNKGQISLQYAVSEDGDHCWNAPRYYVRVDGKWQRDPKKPYNLVRQASLQRLVRKVGTNAYGSPITCWDTNTSTQPWCTNCSSCKYPKETISAADPPTVVAKEAG